MAGMLDDLVDFDAPRARVAVLLDHFPSLATSASPNASCIRSRRFCFLVTCATISSCDDFDDIVAWGEHHLDFLRRFSEFHFGIPCERWLRILVNRVDPTLFAKCFDDWIAAIWPGRHDLIAIDGKTARRTHDRRKGTKALHTLSAYACTARLVLAQVHVAEKSNEITAIPDLLDDLAEKGKLKGALVTIDAMGCQADIADRIIGYGADYCLALKGNQPTLEADVESYFKTAPANEITTTTSVEKGHGRIETRIVSASSNTGWIVSERSYPGQPKFKNIKTIIKIVRRTEHADRCTQTTHLSISSAACDVERLAAAVRGHWGVESMHWLLDVAFKDDLARLRTGHGAKNMSVVRRFALGLVRTDRAKGSVKTKRKAAGWSIDRLAEILQINPC